MRDAFRFVHLADVHLDTPFRARDPELRRRLADAGRQAFRRAVDLAISSGAQAFLVAGDLVDGERLGVESELLLVEETRRLLAADCRPVLVTGNHDPGDCSPLGRIAWPEGVEVISGPTPRTVAVESGGRVLGRVVGLGHATAAVAENLARLFPPAPGPEPVVALLHAQVLSARAAERHDRYAPCSREDLLAPGYDYWALGHVHERQAVLARPPAWYPGNLQGRHFGECGPRGALLVDLDPRRLSAPRVEFVPLAPLRWEVLPLDGLEEVADAGALLERLRRVVAELGEEAPQVEGWLLRLELLGASPLSGELRHEAAAEALARRLRQDLGLLHLEIDASRLHRPRDLGALERREDVLGLALRLLDEARSDPQAFADLLGSETLASRSAAADRRTLLEGLDELVAESLLGEGAE